MVTLASRVVCARRRGWIAWWWSACKRCACSQPAAAWLDALCVVSFAHDCTIEACTGCVRIRVGNFFFWYCGNCTRRVDGFDRLRRQLLCMRPWVWCMTGMMYHGYDVSQMFCMTGMVYHRCLTSSSCALLCIADVVYEWCYVRGMLCARDVMCECIKSKKKKQCCRFKFKFYICILLISIKVFYVWNDKITISQYHNITTWLFSNVNLTGLFCCCMFCMSW